MENDDIVEGDEVIVARKPGPAKRDRTAPYAFLLVAVFVVTYVLVFLNRPNVASNAPAAVNTVEAPQAPATTPATPR